MDGRPKRIAVLCLAGLCLGQASAVLSQKNPTSWRLKNRLQVSYEFDSNIREAPSEAFRHLQDSSLRLLFHSRAAYSGRNTRVTFEYRGGLQSYFENNIENKLINETEVTTAWRLPPIVLGFRGSGRLKLYLNDDLDYVTGSAEAFLQFPSFFSIRNELAVRTTTVNYQNFAIFDYSQNHLRWKFSRKLSQRLNSSLDLSAGRIAYTRVLSEAAPEDPVQSFREIDLKDWNYLIRLQLSYSKKFLINVSYLFERNDSRLPEYEYYKHQFIVLFGLPLSRRLWLRGYGAYQFKDYARDASVTFPIDVDSERDESSFVVADISKDISGSLTAILRLAYYNNESIIRGLFYNKTLLTLGFDFRF